MGHALALAQGVLGCEAVLGLSGLAEQSASDSGAIDATSGGDATPDGRTDATSDATPPSDSGGDASGGDAAHDGDSGSSDSGPADAGIDSGTVLLYEDFENTGATPCGAWDPANATLALATPGYQSAHSCRLCATGTTGMPSYTMLSVTPGLAAYAGQTLVTSAYIQLVPSDGGVVDPQGAYFYAYATADDGGATGHNTPGNNPTVLQATWSPLTLVTVLTQDLNSIQVYLQILAHAPGDCVLVDDIELVAQ